MAIRSSVLDQDYHFEYEVGTWTLGVVQVLRDRKTRGLKTCKVVPKVTLQGSTRFISQLSSLQKLQHRNIAGITDVLEDSRYLFILSDRSPGGDLSELLENMGEINWLQESTCASYIRQILVALAHSHAHRIFHRDLLPTSILLSSRLPDATVKVSDLGLCPILDPYHSAALKNETMFPYIAPEIRKGGPHMDDLPDLWSVGAIAHTLLVGYPPAGGSSWNLRNLVGTSQHDHWDNRSSESHEFVDHLLQSALNRPNAAKALQHPWLKENIPASLIEDMGPRVLCYMLAVLLAPRVIHPTEFSLLRVSFARTDSDRDGFIVCSHVLELINDQGGRGCKLEEAMVLTAASFADVFKVGFLDFCAAMCAVVMVYEIAGAVLELKVQAEHLTCSEMAQWMLRRFFEIYADKKPMVDMALLCTRLRTPTAKAVELHAGVSYEVILDQLPQEGYVDQNTISTELSAGGGHGTPLTSDWLPAHDDETVCWDPTQALDGVLGNVFGTCQLNTKLKSVREQLKSSFTTGCG